MTTRSPSAGRDDLKPRVLSLKLKRSRPMDWRNFDSLMQRIQASFTVSLIAQPLLVPPYATEDDITRFARENRFSQVLFREDVETLKLLEFDARRNYAPSAKPRHVSERDFLSEGTPLPDAITLLMARPYYLVVVRNQIERIITPSDLNRLPVRTYLFTLLAHTEALLAEWILRHYPEDNFMQQLGEGARARVEELFQRKVEHDHDTRRLDCTTLMDKLSVIGKNEAMWKALGYTRRPDYLSDRAAFNQLRNRIHHGMAPIPAPAVRACASTGAHLEPTPAEQHDEEDDSDDFGDGIAHNGQLVWDADTLAWLSRCVVQIREWIPKITTRLECESRQTR
jgi:hypothetical protein